MKEFSKSCQEITTPEYQGGIGTCEWKLGLGGRNMEWDERTGGDQQPAGVGMGQDGVLRIGHALVQLWGQRLTR